MNNTSAIIKRAHASNVAAHTGCAASYGLNELGTCTNSANLKHILRKSRKGSAN
mgnify:CR=1 FL=1